MRETAPLDQLIERVARRDRILVLTGLIAAILLAWAYLLAMPEMETPAPMDMPGMAMAEMQAATSWAEHLPWVFAMWWIMMVAMMLPSAAPMILLFAAITRKQKTQTSPFPPVAFFTLGYLIVWAGFSIAASLAQWALSGTGFIQHGMRIASPVLNAMLLLGAGAWQLSPIKRACLHHCRSPVHYITTHWRKGCGGAIGMGLRHGAFCLGCCWFLMGLLFAGGIMNLYWIIGIAVYVLLEKLAPNGQLLARASGVMLIGAGVWLWFSAS